MSMSLPVAEYWFSFSVRRNRKSYMFATLLLTAVMFAVVGVLWFFGPKRRVGDVIFLLFFIPYVICGYSLTAQRLRDMNVTGWLALLWIPVGVADRFIGGAASLTFYIILCAVSGTKGENNFGPDPLGSMEHLV